MGWIHNSPSRSISIFSLIFKSHSAGGIQRTLQINNHRHLCSNSLGLNRLHCRRNHPRRKIHRKSSQQLFLKHLSRTIMGTFNQPMRCKRCISDNSAILSPRWASVKRRILSLFLAKLTKMGWGFYRAQAIKTHSMPTKIRFTNQFHRSEWIRMTVKLIHSTTSHSDLV